LKKSPHKSVQKSAKSCRCLMLFFVCHAGDSRVWGRHSPTRFPQGQNERKANFGTTVESCSKKLPLSSTADFAAIRRGRLSWFPSIKRVRRRVLPAFAPLYGRKRKMPNAPLDFFITTTAASPFRANFPVTFYNNRNVWSAKNGRKKSSKSFQTYCLCAAVMGGGYLVLNGGIER